MIKSQKNIVLASVTILLIFILINIVLNIRYFNNVQNVQNKLDYLHVEHESQIVFDEIKLEVLKQKENIYNWLIKSDPNIIENRDLSASLYTSFNNVLASKPYTSLERVQDSIKVNDNQFLEFYITSIPLKESYIVAEVDLKKIIPKLRASEKKLESSLSFYTNKGKYINKSEDFLFWDDELKLGIHGSKKENLLSEEIDTFGELFFKALFLRIIILISILILLNILFYRIYKSLEEERHKYKSLFDATSDSIILLDEEGNYLDCNNSALDLFHITNKKEIQILNILDLSPKSQPDGSISSQKIKNLINICKLNNTVSFNWEHQTLQGNPFSSVLHMSKTKINNSYIFQGTVRDITREKQHEKKLINDKEILEALIDSIPDLIFYKDKFGNYMGCNNAYEKYTNLSKNQIIGKDDKALFGEVKANSYKISDHKILKYGTIWKNHDWIEYPDNKMVYAYTIKTPLYNSQKEIIGILGISRDLTEEYLGEIEIKANRELLYETQRIAHIGSWVWNIEEGSLKWSDEVYRIFGLAPKQLKATYEEFLNRIHPEDRDRVSNAVARAVELEEDYIIEHRVICPDGEIKTVREIGDVKRNKEGKPIEMIGSVLDITSYKKIQQDLEDYKNNLEELVNIRTKELENSKIEAEKANKVKTIFLANMSHEIRTPMNSILGFLELISEMNELPEEALEYLEIVNTSARGLLAIINDILDISKLEAGKVKIEKTNVILEDLVKDIINSFSQVTKTKSLQVEYKIENNLKKILLCDLQRLKQVITNLVGNAIKFTENGRVSIRISKLNNGCFQVAISDTGIGMSKDQVDNMFAPFVQADSSISRKFGGTGLGTTISKELVNLMGGDIWVDSEIGIGTTVYFTIPLVLEITGTKKTAEEKEFINKKSNIKKYNILVVEDIPENSLLITIRLKQFGYNAIVANNGIEALKLYKENHFDLILMDVHMPIMDGLETTKKIREFDTQIPILALTASVLKEETYQCFQAGMNDIVSKPIIINELLEKLSHYIGSSSSEEQLNKTDKILEIIKISEELKDSFKRGEVDDKLVSSFINLLEFIYEDNEIEELEYLITNYRLDKAIKKINYLIRSLNG